MEIQVIDLVVSLFFLSALVLIRKFRSPLKRRDVTSYRNISAGLVILNLVMVSRLYAANGMLQAVPFLSEPTFYQLCFWIGVITGMIFLVSGVSTWLPLAKQEQQGRHFQIQHLNFIKHIEQLIGVERRTPVILNKALQHMGEAYRLKRAAVYLCSYRRTNPFLLSTYGKDDMPESKLEEIAFHKKFKELLTSSNLNPADTVIHALPEGMTKPNLVLPVVVEEKVLAVFLLWESEESPLEREDYINLKIAAGIIARKIELEKLHGRHAMQKKQTQWLESFRQAVDWHKPLRDVIPGVAKWIAAMVPVDMLIFTVVYDEKNVKRITIGKDGTLLQEKGIDIASSTNFLERILSADRPVMIKDVHGKTHEPLDKMILKSGMKSVAAFRLGYGESMRGALVIASEQANRYSAREVELIRNVSPLLNQILAREISQHVHTLMDKRMEHITTFLAECARTTKLQDLFDRAAKLLMKELRTTLVRISTYEYDGSFLQSRALTTIRPMEKLTPPDGHMILSLMPYHTLVRETGRVMMINQEKTDKKIPEAEARQIGCDGLKSALLVPVTVQGQVLAVISLTEKRRWSRYQYTPSDVLFVRSIASGLALAIQLALGKKKKISLRHEEDIVPSPVPADPMIRGRIKSSLSSIIGSMEIIKSHTLQTERNLDQYFSIIDRSVKKIHDYVQQDHMLS